MQQYTKDWLSEICKTSFSYAEVLRKAGRSQGGGAQSTLKKKIAEYDIDVSHFTGQHWQASPNQINNHESREIYSLDQILIKDSPVTQKMLRGYLKRHNVFEYKCKNCGCDGTWKNGTIALEVDHINGDNNDNRIETYATSAPTVTRLLKHTADATKEKTAHSNE